MKQKEILAILKGISPWEADRMEESIQRNGKWWAEEFANAIEKRTKEKITLTQKTSTQGRGQSFL